jgi:rare lipoprotein A
MAPPRAEPTRVNAPVLPSARGDGTAVLLRRILGQRCRQAVHVAIATLLAACASTADRDGPPLKVPAGLENLRDAEPKVEAIRNGGPNSPYRVLGRDYVPMTRDVAFRQKGLASWYGRKFHGRPTASGEPYDMFAMTAAHPTLPIPSYARISNPGNGRSVVVRINDRGPFHDGRIVDLSYAAAWKLGVLGGVAPVALQRITFSDIRNGAWPGASSAVHAVYASPGDDQALLVTKGLHSHRGDALRRGDAGAPGMVSEPGGERVGRDR